MDKNKLKLTLLLIAVALPLGLATFSFNTMKGVGVRSTTNNGVLIQPVMDITDFGMVDENGTEEFLPFEEMVLQIDLEDYEPRPWTLIFLGTNSCDQACGDRLFYLRQLHRLLSGDADRVKRYYVNVGTKRAAFDDRTELMFDESFINMTVVYSSEESLREKLAAKLPEVGDPIAEHYIFVADPLGNVMMYFTPENTPDEILEDIEKLLDRSSLG